MGDGCLVRTRPPQQNRARPGQCLMRTGQCERQQVIHIPLPECGREGAPSHELDSRSRYSRGPRNISAKASSVQSCLPSVENLAQAVAKAAEDRACCKTFPISLYHQASRALRRSIGPVGCSRLRGPAPPVCLRSGHWQKPKYSRPAEGIVTEPDSWRNDLEPKILDQADYIVRAFRDSGTDIACERLRVVVAECQFRGVVFPVVPVDLRVPWCVVLVRCVRLLVLGSEERR